MLFNLIMLAVPVVFLCASAILAVKAFEHGKNRKKTVLTQICSFAAICILHGMPYRSKCCYR